MKRHDQFRRWIAALVIGGLVLAGLIVLAGRQAAEEASDDEGAAFEYEPRSLEPPVPPAGCIDPFVDAICNGLATQETDACDGYGPSQCADPAAYMLANGFGIPAWCEGIVQGSLRADCERALRADCNLLDKDLAGACRSIRDKTDKCDGSQACEKMWDFTEAVRSRELGRCLTIRDMLTRQRCLGALSHDPAYCFIRCS